MKMESNSNSKTTKYYVAGFMYSKDRKKVALIQKLQPAWQKGLLNGIGGKIELGESPAEAMSREFQEETGVVTTKEQWQLFSTVKKEGEYFVYFFFSITDKVYDVKTIEAEKVDIYDVDNLPKNMINNLNWLIPMSLDQKIDLKEPIKIKEISD